MKAARLLLVLSVIANVVLLAVWLRLGNASSTAMRAPSGTESAAAVGTETAKVAGSAGAKKSGDAAGAITPWSRLGSGDLHATVANLRAAGFPPSLVRRIIATLVDERFDVRRLAIRQANESDTFWGKLTDANAAEKIAPEMQKLQIDETAMMRDLLGGNLGAVFADSEDEEAILRLQIGSIDMAKIGPVYDATVAYGQGLSKIYAATNNGRTMTNADREQLAALSQAMQSDLSKILPPDQLADFMMRATPESAQLRNTLVPFDATEAEFRAIFPLYQAFQNQFPSAAANLPPEQAEARRIAEAAMDAQVTVALGASRGADFQQAMNPDYSLLNRLVNRLQLPITAAEQVASVQQDATQQASAIRADSTLSPADRTAQLRALQDQVTAKVTATLGPNGMETYRIYGGQWLRALAPAKK